MVICDTSVFCYGARFLGDLGSKRLGDHGFLNDFARRESAGLPFFLAVGTWSVLKSRKRSNVFLLDGVNGSGFCLVIWIDREANSV